MSTPRGDPGGAAARQTGDGPAFVWRADEVNQ
jgi:hypothetical protein